MSPREATTNDKICKLKRDNISTKASWINLHHDGVTIGNQRVGYPPTGTVRLTRKAFEKFIDWYNKQQP